MKNKILCIILSCASLAASIIGSIRNGCLGNPDNGFLNSFLNNLLNFLLCYIFFDIIFNSFSQKHPIIISICSFIFGFLLSYFFQFNFMNLKYPESVGIIANGVHCIIYLIRYHMLDKEEKIEAEIKSVINKTKVEQKKRKSKEINV